MIGADEIRHAVRAAAQPKFIEDAAELARCAVEWHSKRVLGIDTEFLRERTYRAELGLVQISDGDTAWLVDPLKVGSLEPLAELFRDPAVTKVLHSASEDLEVLWLALGAVPRPMVDTQIACALLGQPLQQGYDRTVMWLCGIELDKQHTRSNWLIRPLSTEQLHYAANDVVFLPVMHRELRDRLETEGRWAWLAEETELMLRQSTRNLDAEEAWRRIRGAGRLGQPELRVLQALAAWREEVAKARNLARGFVVPDTALLAIAGSKPNSRDDLGSIASLHPRVIQRYGEKMLGLTRAALESEREVEAELRLDRRQEQLIDAMRELVRSKGESLGVDPALLASRRVLETLLRAALRGEPVPDRLQGWRKEVITDALLVCIQPAVCSTSPAPARPAAESGADSSQQLELAPTDPSPGSSVDRAPAS